MSGGLRCPACRTVVMRPSVDSVTQLEIDSCPKCSGLWFDGHELSVFLQSPHLKGRFLLPEASQPAASVGYTINTKQRACPRCRVGMSEKVFAGVELDVCGKCEGIWFDEGEVRRVVDQFRSGRRTGERVVEQEVRKGLSRPSGGGEGEGLFHSLREFLKSAVTGK